MSPTQFIKPAIAGDLVRDPADLYRPLPAEGKNVTWSLYWDRLLERGEIMIADPPKAIKPRTSPAPASPEGGNA